MTLGPQFSMFHGTVRKGWTPPEYFHAGDLQSATRRLDAVTDRGGFEYDDSEDRDPSVYRLKIRPEATVHPLVEAVEDPETGMWNDLGHRLEEGSEPPSAHDFDVVPYENVDEGGTSYWVRGSAVQSSRLYKRRRS